MGMMREMTPNHAGLGSESGRLRRRRERNERARTTQANASIEHAGNIIDTTANLAIIATQQDDARRPHRHPPGRRAPPVLCRYEVC